MIHLFQTHIFLNFIEINVLVAFADILLISKIQIFKIQIFFNSEIRIRVIPMRNSLICHCLSFFRFKMKLASTCLIK